VRALSPPFCTKCRSPTTVVLCIKNPGGDHVTLFECTKCKWTDLYHEVEGKLQPWPSKIN
jgi:hypothetical protein